MRTDAVAILEALDYFLQAQAVGLEDASARALDLFERVRPIPGSTAGGVDLADMLAALLERMNGGTHETNI